jgi:hypothetical protein
MATLEQVRAILPIGVFPEIRKAENVFLVRYRDHDYTLPEAEVDLFLARELSSPSETSVHRTGYYEHALQRLSIFRPPYGADRETILLSSDESVRAEVSNASIEFLLKIIQRADLPRIFFRVFSRVTPGLHRPERPFRESFRILTIKVFASDQVEYRARAAKMRAVAEACLFHLAYGGGVALNLSRSWERDAYRLRPERTEQVQFPRRTYNSDLVAYYQLAVASDSLILAFLALYKIVEYFFSKVAEDGLHQRVVQRLIAPEFTHAKPTQLRQLVSTIRKYDQKMDEEKTLAAVVEYYFRPDEIITWVRAHEAEVGTYFTVPQTVLGQPLTLDLNVEQFAFSIAKRIYHLRNALVHHKEGDLPRFIPFSGQESVLSSEIPLLQFLAEQLILKSGTDI